MNPLMAGLTYQAIERQRRLKLFFFIASMLMLGFAIVAIKNIFISFILAFVIYYSLAPIVDHLERRGFSRQWSTTIPFLILSVVGLVVLQYLAPRLTQQISTLKSSFPSYLQSINDSLQNMESQIRSALDSLYPVDIRSKVEPWLKSYLEEFVGQIPDYLSQSLTIILLSPFFAYFMLLDGRNFVRQILGLVPNNLFELALNLSHQISDQMGGFIRARTIESILVSLVIWLGLFVLGFPYAILLAIFAGILNIIPYLGPFIGAAPALLLCIGSPDTSHLFLWVVLVYALAQIIDIAVIVPFVIAKIVNLHPVTVVMAVIIGSQLMGVLGMIISIPVFSALKVSASAIYKHLTEFRS